MQEILLKDVWKSFNDVKAIRGLSFDAEEGKTLTILGPSGAGKTTTLRLIAGLEKVDSGEIYLEGKNTSGMLPYERNLTMTFESYALYPHITVFENIAFPLKAPNRKIKYSKEQIRQKVKEMADSLGIGDFLERMPRELSGGQKQRVALGRTLIKESKIYLFDEPIAHLDAQLRYKTRGEMKKIFERLNSTVIYTTHDYSEAAAISREGDKVMVINFGELQQIGTSDEIFNNPANDFVFSITCEPEPNFIKVNLVEESNLFYLKCEDFTYPINGNFLDTLLSEKKRIFKIGIRPNDIRVNNEKSESTSVLGEVYTYEFLGSKYLALIRIGKTKLFAEIDKTMDIDIGKKIWLGFDNSKLYAFDLQSGTRFSQRRK